MVPGKLPFSCERLGPFLVCVDVQCDNNKTAIFPILIADSLNLRKALNARAAPRRPEVQQYVLAAKSAYVDDGPIKLLELNIRSLFTDLRCPMASTATSPRSTVSLSSSTRNRTTRFPNG